MPIYTVPSPAITVPTGSVATTCIQLSSASTRRLRTQEVWSSASSVTAADLPMLVEVLLETSAGTTPTGSITPVPIDQAEPAALFSANYGPYATDPSGSTVFKNFMFSPIGSTLIYQAPQGNEIVLPVSSRIGVRATSPQQEASTRWQFQVME